jgi:hypothetical protein
MNVLNNEESDFFVASQPCQRSPRPNEKSAKTGQKSTICAGAPADASWSPSCSQRHMETHKWLQRVALLILFLVLAAPASAHRLDRVRGDSRNLQVLISSGVQRSPTIRAIVDRLEASDLIVEVQCGLFKSSLQAGRTVLLSARPSVRYVLVEIACPQADAPALEILGHELRHALEIASAPWVVDEQSLEKLYSQIGYTNCLKWGGLSEFETADAIEAGERVHHELFHQAASTRRVAKLLTK